VSRSFLLILCLAASALWPVRPAAAQAITGQVIDANTTGGILAVDIRLLDRGGIVRGTAVSDSMGWFRVVAPLPGTYRVQASRLGYQSVTTEGIQLDGEELRIEVRMSTSAVVLEPLRITGRRTFRPGRLTGYYDRAEWTTKTGLGRIYARDDIEKLNLPELNALFRQTPGLISPVLSSCVYMLDTHIVEPDVLNTMIKPEEVEGVEIYRRRTEIPMEYLPMADDCLVLVWTRLDPPGARPFTWKRVLFGASLIGFLMLVLPSLRN